MGDCNFLCIGVFLAPVLQGILIHIISYMVIEFFKNRKQKEKRTACTRPFLFDPIMGTITFVKLIIYHLATKYKSCFVTPYEGQGKGQKTLWCLNLCYFTDIE